METCRIAQQDRLFINACRSSEALREHGELQLTENEQALVEARDACCKKVAQAALSAIITLTVDRPQYEEIMTEAWNLVHTTWSQPCTSTWVVSELRRLIRLRAPQPH